MGEHRLPLGKNQPYEPDTTVPYYVRGPGIDPGSSSDKLAGNVDLPLTFADIAGATTPSYVEGRSLLPILRGSAPDAWRQTFLLERRAGGHAFVGLRMKSSTFVQFENGEGEYYRLDRDPYQLRNAYGTMSDDLKRDLRALADELGECAGAECRAIESREVPTDPEP